MMALLLETVGPAQAAQNNTQNLDAKIIDTSATAGHEFRTICSAAHWLCGIESSNCFDIEDSGVGPVTKEHIPQIRKTEYRNMRATLALNKAARMHPGYVWDQSGGIIHVHPKIVSSPDLLSMRLDKVSIHDETSEDAFWQVLKQAGIQPVNGKAYEMGDVVESYGVISLELSNVTVREAFDAIATADGAVFWEFGPVNTSEPAGCFDAGSWGSGKNRRSMMDRIRENKSQ